MHYISLFSLLGVLITPPDFVISYASLIAYYSPQSLRHIHITLIFWWNINFAPGTHGLEFFPVIAPGLMTNHFWNKPPILLNTKTWRLQICSNPGDFFTWFNFHIVWNKIGSRVARWVRSWAAALMVLGSNPDCVRSLFKVLVFGFLPQTPSNTNIINNQKRFSQTFCVGCFVFLSLKS